MRTLTTTPYGALEIKRAYQKNMLAGTASTVLLTALIIFSIWLYAVLTPPIIIEEPAIIVRTIVDIGPPPSVIPTDPQIKIDRPKAPGSKIKIGIPVPVSNEEMVEEEETRLPTREELMSINTPSFTDSGNGFGGVVIAPEQILEEPDPREFIPYEKQPELIYEEMPKYPRLAEAAGFTAKVWVEVLVNEKGDAVKAQVAKCTREGLGFEEEAIKAALKCKYRPAIQNGLPMPCWIAYKFNFTQDR